MLTSKTINTKLEKYLTQLTTKYFYINNKIPLLTLNK